MHVIHSVTLVYKKGNYTRNLAADGWSVRSVQQRRSRLWITGHPLSISQPPYTDATFNGGKTEKTKHTRRFIISKLRSCGKNREFLLTPHSPAFVPPEARPSRPFIFTLCPSFPQLFAAGKKAPALFGKKWTESDRRRRENDATRTSPAAGEGEHPEVPQEFYGNYADPADRVRSLPVGNHRRQQIRGVYPLRAVRRCLLLAPHPGPFLPHPAGEAGPRAFAGRGSLVVHQPGARRGRRGALPAGHWRHDPQYQSKLILQLASVHASMSVQSLPDSRCVRLLLLAGLPPVRYFWSVQKVSKRVNCWAAWKPKGGHGKMRNS